jgi:tyrosyl-tRNA synthetase
MAAQEFLDDLQWRGLIAQTTDLGALHAALDEGPLTLYCGFDPTAQSLHVGNLVPLLLLRRFQQAGHRPIALVGGATGLIGDPSGRTTERTLNSDDTVAEWVALIRTQVETFVGFHDGPNGAVVVSNLEWTRDLTAIELLREVGKHFSVNQMLAKESVHVRLSGAGISFTEFSYMVLQAFDYLELFRRHDCRLQIGGSDQWGNITAGLDLIRRVEGHDVASTHALTVPLVTKSDGTKFGKTAGGTVWLDSGLTSAYAFYQYWFNADDRDVVPFLKYFSFRSRTEIEELIEATESRPAAREAQRALAEELTTLVHGQQETIRVMDASRALFGQGDLGALDPDTLDAALRETPHHVVPPGEPIPPYADLLAVTELVTSKSAARRTIVEAGAYLNNARVDDVDFIPTTADLIHGRWLVLRRGKRAVAGVRVER